MKASETVVGEKPLKRVGNVGSIHAPQVRDYENRKRMLVLGRTSTTSKYCVSRVVLVFLMVPCLFHPCLLYSCVLPYFFP